MKEVANGIWVGSDADVPEAKRRGFAICSVCKHGDFGHAVTLGYKGAAPSGPERLFAKRGRHFVANAVDTPTAHPDGFKALDAAVAYVLAMVEDDIPVLVHCNQGGSRGPGVALQAMRELGIPDAEKEFLTKYPTFAPAGGVKAWLEVHA